MMGSVGLGRVSCVFFWCREGASWKKRYILAQCQSGTRAGPALGLGLLELAAVLVLDPAAKAARTLRVLPAQVL